LSHPKSPLSGVIAWGLYDWANSAFPATITTFIFAAYFTQAIAPNPIIGTNQWGNATALAGLIIAILSPILGAAADNIGRRKPWVAFFTLITIISSALLWFAKPSPAYTNWALTFVVLGTIGFELGIVFYNAMMQDLVSKEYLGRLSGWSWGAGYIGGLACLIVALVLIRSGASWFNLDSKTAEHVRMAGPLVAIWFALFSLPFFFLTPDRKSTGMSLTRAIHTGILTLINTFKNLGSYRQILKFLLAHMIYIDGVNSLFIFGGIYAAGTFGLKPDDLILFGIGMNITAGIGAISFGWVDDYFGSKNTILIALACLIFFTISLLLTYSILWFWILALLLCLFFGPVQAASRALMARMAPKEKLTELFGLYALSGKATAFLGPWLFGIVTLIFASQRIGMVTVLLFYVVGALVLLSVKTDK